MKRSALLLGAGALLTGCGLAATPPQTPVHSVEKIAWHPVSIPSVRWRPVSIGPEVLLNEGGQISSVLAGPSGRIYYGTSNPLADSSTIGWINPLTNRNQWAFVPKVSPLFPRGSHLTNLNLTESAYWGSVDLVVSGSHNVWYRHWGYIGGWSSNGKFVPGAYAVPGPTVHQGNLTASVNSNFTGVEVIKLMNVVSHALSLYKLPSQEAPVSMAFDPNNSHVLWLLTSTALWQLNIASGQWNEIAALGSGDFFVSLGHWGQTLWVIDANGGIGTISQASGIHWLTTLSVSPLKAVTAGTRGLWVVSLHHLSLWRPNQPLKQWSWPKLKYPDPAAKWPVQGAQTPPDWPPIPHINPGPHNTVVLGYGTWIGQARLQVKNEPTNPVH